MITNFDNKIVTLGGLATFQSGMFSYIAGQIEVMDNNDVDAMMVRVLGGSDSN